MDLKGAVLKENGVTLALVEVKSHIIANSIEALDTFRSFAKYFPGMPIVLMSQNHCEKPTYLGRKDIVNFLANLKPNQIPWRQYTFND